MSARMSLDSLGNQPRNASDDQRTFDMQKLASNCYHFCPWFIRAFTFIILLDPNHNPL